MAAQPILVCLFIETGTSLVMEHKRCPTGTCRIQNPDIPRAGRVEAHRGVAGRSRAGLDANKTVRPRDKPTSYLPKHRRHVA